MFSITQLEAYQIGPGSQHKIATSTVYVLLMSHFKPVNQLANVIAQALVVKWERPLVMVQAFIPGRVLYIFTKASWSAC